MQNSRKTLTSGIFLLAACLCFSQAKAPGEQWEHLYKGSPLLVAEDKAWIVQEPRVFSTGRVVSMEFGPGPNEAVAVTVPRETISAQSALSMGDSDTVKPGSLSRVSVINLDNGSVKYSVALPGTAEKGSGFWVSKGRLLLVACRTAEGFAQIIVDLIQGQTFRLPNGSGLMPVISEAPQLALCSSSEHIVYPKPQDGLAAAPKPMSCVLLDFSQRPPSTRSVSIPVGAGSPRALTREGTLICSAGKEGYRELNLQNGTVRAFDERRAVALLNSLQSSDFSGQLDLEQEQDGGYRLFAPKGGLRPSTELSREADDARINAAQDKVIFTAHGAGFVVALTPIDLASALKALLAHARQAALTNGKQAAVAAMIYCADYDDILPVSGGQAKDALMPYLKDAGILSRVVWTNMTGQNLTGISDPSSTELGYYPGPGGRAIIYVDGHVVWKPDP